MLGKVYIAGGDISKISADALITTINSKSLWYGTLDAVIRRAAGDQFHSQALAVMPLSDGQTVVARKQSAHRGAFGDVVFVIDDLEKPLRQVVLAGLNAAETAGYKTITLPMIRMGVMRSMVERSVQEAINEMAAGARSFLDTKPSCVQSITFVVYKDTLIESLLTAALK